MTANVSMIDISVARTVAEVLVDLLFYDPADRMNDSFLMDIFVEAVDQSGDVVTIRLKRSQVVHLVYVLRKQVNVNEAFGSRDVCLRQYENSLKRQLQGMKMNKTIEMYYINRIKNCKLRIFAAEDDDCPDGRIVAQNERAIEHWLDQACVVDPDLRYELEENINWVNDDCCGVLEKLGWTITKGEQ